MDLIVDDRERAVVAFLKALCEIKVDRITVGDYAFAFAGKIVAIVERKTLADLASSIKDGRMENNKKLLDAQAKTGCKILYVIEGRAYPALHSKIGRMPYKCLQGKLDSLMFRHDIKIIWTKDCQHTAERLAGLRVTFEKMAAEGVFGAPAEERRDMAGGAGGADDPNAILKAKHAMALDLLHVNMLKKVPSVSHSMAVAVLRVYTIQQVLLGDVDLGTLMAMRRPDSDFKLGNAGARMFAQFQTLKTDADTQAKILACVPGVTDETARQILSNADFGDIVSGIIQPGVVAGIAKTLTRKIGTAIEARLRAVFATTPGPIRTPATASGAGGSTGPAAALPG